MAPNGTAMSRKTPSTQGKPSARMDGHISFHSLFDDFEDAAKSPPQDLKKRLPLAQEPGKWSKDVLSIKGEDIESARSTPSIEPPKSIRKTFPNKRVMGDKGETLKCNHCKRAVSKFAMPKHIEGCLNKKQEKQRKKKEAKDARDAAARKEKAGDSDDEDDEGAKKTSKGGMTASKKRKAEDGVEDSGPTKKKKKKDEPKTKVPRPKAPVDVEKQCGVELPQGGQCARSLTCKSHSMGAKRAVPGRSAPYDKLLMEYQRKNQAKQQKAAFDANAPNPDDDDLPTGPVDSEEEKDAVVSAITQNWRGTPLYQPVYVPLRKKYEYNRLKSQLQGAFSNKGGGIFGTGSFNGKSSIFSSAPPPVVEAPDGTLHARKGSVVPGARSMMAPMAHPRKPSIASGA